MVVIMVAYSLQVSADDSNLIDISSTTLSNDQHLFDLENIKPGDWADRELEITNRTSHDLSYEININYLSGSEMFYEELELEIKSADKILFQDRLADFQKIDERALAAEATDTIALHLLFPPELGNDFQGLTTNAEIVIRAFDHTEEQVTSFTMTTDSSGEIGSTMPDTASFLFNFLLLGAVLLLAGGLIILLSRKKIDY